MNIHAPLQNNSELFIIINEFGDLFFNADEPAIKDQQVIQNIYSNMRLTEKSELKTELNDQIYFIESFDHPIIATQLQIHRDQIELTTKHGIRFLADMKKWSVDEWDRFNGITLTKIPFILCDSAQDELFDSVDSFNDEGFIINGRFFETPPFFLPQTMHDSSYWEKVYETESNPGWNLNQPAEALKDMLPRLKLPKSRILVLGAGEGHDAALFAQAGHVVTAVDFSNEAIRRGQEKYSELTNLTFYKENIFNLPSDWKNSFDLVVEHTCFCAIPPTQRNELIQIWSQMLHDQGQLMSVFFAMEKPFGPPFGATEWEIRKRLLKKFQILFWGRWRQSLPQRQGRELFVLGQKKGGGVSR